MAQPKQDTWAEKSVKYLTASSECMNKLKYNEYAVQAKFLVDLKGTAEGKAAKAFFYEFHENCEFVKKKVVLKYMCSGDYLP